MSLTSPRGCARAAMELLATKIMVSATTSWPEPQNHHHQRHNKVPSSCFPAIMIARNLRNPESSLLLLSALQVYLIAHLVLQGNRRKAGVTQGFSTLRLSYRYVFHRHDDMNSIVRMANPRGYSAFYMMPCMCQYLIHEPLLQCLIKYDTRRFTLTAMHTSEYSAKSLISFPSPFRRQSCPRILVCLPSSGLPSSSSLSSCPSSLRSLRLFVPADLLLSSAALPAEISQFLLSAQTCIAISVSQVKNPEESLDSPLSPTLQLLLLLSLQRLLQQLLVVPNLLARCLF